MTKVDNIEYEKRIRIVMEWILDDWRSTDIIAQIVIKWGVVERQAKRYVSEARKRWMKDESIVLEQKRKLKSESLKKLKRSLHDRYKGTPEGIRAVLMVEKELIALEGLSPAIKLQHSQMGPDGNVIDPSSKIILNLPVGLDISLPNNTEE